MEIIQQAIINSITISVNDSWDIGNGLRVIIKEIFEIDGQVYITTITDGQPMPSFKINPEDEELITPNRFINLAEIWVKKNSRLF